MSPTSKRITVGELAARFLEQCGVRAAFGVISIHNMPILDAFHTRSKIRFVSARGEAGACNMADAYARVSGTLGVCVTSTGTGCGNAAGAMVEAITAGTPLLHLTGQIESDYLDRDLGYIHEHPAQLAMLKSVGKDAFRIRNPETALATLREAVRLAQTPPCAAIAAQHGRRGRAGRSPAEREAPPAVAGRRRAWRERGRAAPGGHGLGGGVLGARPRHRARRPPRHTRFVQPAEAGRGVL
jgi:Thiamine pyrophosphate enzyme, N-terminal TPP binding domain